MLWFYFNLALTLFRICSYLSIYLFHIFPSLALRQVFSEFSWLFSRVKAFFAQAQDSLEDYWLWIKDSQLASDYGEKFFALELAFSHSLFFRLFLGLISLNPVYLFISLSISLVLAMNSFSSEFNHWCSCKS